MNWKRIAALICGAIFIFCDAWALFFTWAWLRFEPYEKQILGSSGDFLIPGSKASNGLDSISAEAFQSLAPISVALLVVALLGLIGAIRLSHQ